MLWMLLILRLTYTGDQVCVTSLFILTIYLKRRYWTATSRHLPTHNRVKNVLSLSYVVVLSPKPNVARCCVHAGFLKEIRS